MLHLISRDGQITSPSFISDTSLGAEVSNCLGFIKKVLNLDAKMTLIESNSCSYKLLTEMATDKSSVEFKGKIFIPIRSKDLTIWGFLEIKANFDKPSPARLKKAVQAVQDIIEPALESDQPYKQLKRKSSSMLVLGSSIEDGHRAATTAFQRENHTSFVNLSEWPSQDDQFSLGSLREFNGSLLYVPEILDLNEKQRAALALFALLPEELRSSSLVLCTKSPSIDHLDQTLKKEKAFIKAFSDKCSYFKSGLKDQTFSN